VPNSCKATKFQKTTTQVTHCHGGVMTPPYSGINNSDIQATIDPSENSLPKFPLFRNRKPREISRGYFTERPR